MKRRIIRDTVAVALSALLVAGTVCDAALAQPAQGGRRGANFERSGPAARGGFSTPRPADRAVNRPKPRPKAQGERTERTEIRQDARTERTELRQEGRTERNADRADAARDIAADRNASHHRHYYDDDDDWGGVAAGVAVGAVVGFVAGAAAASPPVAVTYVTVPPCEPVVVVSSNVSHYGCAGTWYHRRYIDGAVRYVVVKAPPGY